MLSPMSIERTKLNWSGWGWAAHRVDPPVDEAVWSWLAGELGMPALLATPARPFEDIKLPPSALAAADLRMLAAAVGAENVRITDYERIFHALGRGGADLLRLRAGEIPLPPDAVIYPRNAREVMLLIKLCETLGIAVVPFGGGTNLTGGVNVARGKHNAAVTVDMALMDRMVEIDPEAGLITAEAGITGPELEKALADKGLMLGHVPYSFEFSTLGGWIAEDSVSSSAGRDGRVGDWLVGVKMATPEGWLKNAHLAIGSRGMLGIIVEATVRVRPLPETRRESAWFFPNFSAAAAAARASLRLDAHPSALHLSDAEATRIVETLRTLTAKPPARSHLMNVFSPPPVVKAGACQVLACFEGEKSHSDAAQHGFAAAAGALGGYERPVALAGGFRRIPLAAPYLRDVQLDRGVGVAVVMADVRWRQLETMHRNVCAALDATIRQTVPREGARGCVFAHIVHAAPEGAVLCFTAIYPRNLGQDIAQAEEIEAAARAAIIAETGSDTPLPVSIRRALDPNGVLNPGLTTDC
jgi:alkyldihydroxyacetonephosphate synthase